MKKIKTLFLLLTISISSFAQSLTDTIQIPEVAVTGSYSAAKQTPFTFKNLSQKDISLRSTGTEPAVLLSTTPSVTFYSDNGTGLGYMYYRLRGIDQTRINSTLNGIPLNEPEDQGVYYNNYGGFLNSVSNIQIIRGAGLSKPGVSSYGGSLNFSSLEFTDKLSGFSNLLYGSYNTFSITGGINSPHFFLLAGKTKTDGYRNNSFNDSWSTFYGGNFSVGKNYFKVYGFVGKQKNGMAWLGEPLDSINKDPKHNTNTKDEVDDFLYVHNQLTWQNGHLKATVYHTYLNGWYTTDMGHFDPIPNPNGSCIWKLALKSNWLGTNVNYNLPLGDVLYLNLGTNAYTYSREHQGTYTSLYPSYTNTGTRNEVSPYAKAEIRINKVWFYGDIQYRYTTFNYDGDPSMLPQEWRFLNWSSGVSIKVKEHSSIYYGIGKTNREPTRNDIFQGSDNFLGYNDIPDYWGPGIPYQYKIINPEEALNNELGWKYKTDYLLINANFYYMDFKNEIVLNGKYGPNSIVLHQNAAESYRSGIEFDLDYKATTHWQFLTSNSFSFNQIQQDGETFQPVLTPSLLLSGDVVCNLSKSVYTGLNVRFNGKSYIDFSNENQLPSYALLSVYGGITWKGILIKGTVNNVLNDLVLTNGIIGAEPLYFVMAGINGSVSLTYKF